MTRLSAENCFTLPAHGLQVIRAATPPQYSPSIVVIRGYTVSFLIDFSRDDVFVAIYKLTDVAKCVKRHRQGL